MKYRVRCTLWQIDGPTADAAKKTVCQILRTMPERFIFVEIAEKPRHWILRLLLFVLRGREGGHFRGERGPTQRLRDGTRDAMLRFVTCQRSTAAW